MDVSKKIIDTKMFCFEQDFKFEMHCVCNTILYKEFDNSNKHTSLIELLSLAFLTLNRQNFNLRSVNTFSRTI